MSRELSVKELSCIYYLLFSHNSCNQCASDPFRRLQFKRPNDPDAPDRSPSTTIVCISASLQLKEEGDIHREERGGMMMGLYIWGWYGDMMMLDLHLVVHRHFMIRIISLATVSLLWLGHSASFPPMRTKESLMVLDDCWISCMKLSSLVVYKDRLFMELMHISRASDLLSWRRIFLVAVFFAVILFASSISLLFTSTCLHCATLSAASYIPNVELGFLLVI